MEWIELNGKRMRWGILTHGDRKINLVGFESFIINIQSKNKLLSFFIRKIRDLRAKMGFSEKHPGTSVEKVDIITETLSSKIRIILPENSRKTREERRYLYFGPDNRNWLFQRWLRSLTFCELNADRQSPGRSEFQSRSDRIVFTSNFLIKERKNTSFSPFGQEISRLWNCGNRLNWGIYFSFDPSYLRLSGSCYLKHSVLEITFELNNLFQEMFSFLNTSRVRVSHLQYSGTLFMDSIWFIAD
jgi:hypothetical protein